MTFLKLFNCVCVAVVAAAVLCGCFAEQRLQKTACFDAHPNFVGCISTAPGQSFSPTFEWRFYYAAYSGRCIRYLSWRGCLVRTTNSFVSERDCQVTCMAISNNNNNNNNDLARSSQLATAQTTTATKTTTANRTLIIGTSNWQGGSRSLALPTGQGRPSINPRCNTLTYNSQSVNVDCPPTSGTVMFEYDQQKGSCQPFNYDGCRPNVRNMFPNIEVCRTSCENFQPSPKTSTSTRRPSRGPSNSKCPPGVTQVNCFVNPCDVTKCAGTCKADYCGGCNAICSDSDTPSNNSI